MLKVARNTTLLVIGMSKYKMMPDACLGRQTRPRGRPNKTTSTHVWKLVISRSHRKKPLILVSSFCKVIMYNTSSSYISAM